MTMPALSLKSIAMPPWTAVALSDLAQVLAAAPWSVVEFWAPDCLFSRLLAPTRVTLAARYDRRVALLRCEVQGGEPECAAWGVSALPAIVLFKRGRRSQRWIGAVHVSLLTRSVDAVLGDAMPTAGAGTCT